MSAEEVSNAGVNAFRGFGHPRQAPHYEVSVDPTMQRMLSEINADMEAKRVRAEAEMLTYEGRKRTAEAKLEEKRRKENQWLSRVILDRGDGWKPIWGTAEDEELKIYTLLDSGEHRFWGVKPVGMGIDEFWEKYDPELRRFDDRQQETPLNPDAPTGPLIGEPPRTSTHRKAAEKPGKQQKAHSLKRTKSDAKLNKRQTSPVINPVHRVRKSTKPPAKVNTNTRNSLALKVNSRTLELEDQVRSLEGAAPARGRPARNKAALAAGSQQKAASTNVAVQANTPSQHKRPRGRPPPKEKPTQKKPNQKKASVVKGNARVVKSSQKEPRPMAPSTHKMRTRRAGPAESLQLP